MSTQNPAAPNGPTFFGHPRGLSTLFFTEMWERFSFYGMRALLVLFMVDQINQNANGGLGMDAVTAGAIYGIYTGMVYLVALPGGWIADRVMGQRSAVLWGGIIIAAGHFSMAIPGTPTFFLGLVLIVIGTGLLKPNISAMVADLYPEGGARRDAGFTIFYMGINIGAFAAPIICSYLGENIDWHYGFGAAGVGMVLGVVQYILGARHLKDAGLFRGNPVDQARDKSRMIMGLVAGTILVGGLAFLLTNGTLTPPALAKALTAVIILVAILYFVYMAFFSGLDSVERKRVGVIAILFLAAALFWSGFEQAGSSLNLFAKQLTDRMVGSFEVPAGWLQSVNALFIIAFAPVFASLWMALSARKKEPSSPAKFGIGLFLLGIGFLIMVPAAIRTGYDGETGKLVGSSWLIMTYLFHTFGELCLSPVGLSTMTKLAPKRFVGQVMGVWFMATALGNVIGGQVAGLFESLPLPQIFGAVALFTAGFGLLLLLFVKPIRKLMGGVH
ncbi:MAG: peptide MFS transporter [Deltaproteobacteria bacterium]|nr:peptide MFS transporter [Deltaproteobacteria bacterium]